MERDGGMSCSIGRYVQAFSDWSDMSLNIKSLVVYSAHANRSFPVCVELMVKFGNLTHTSLCVSVARL